MDLHLIDPLLDVEFFCLIIDILPLYIPICPFSLETITFTTRSRARFDG